ncbi:WD40 repeat-like protein [Rhizodiscina lignyota]|uniref:WD40 repeat-like protein n=1 Tax=Rhizodiscina lignyota TaxID=1504668 RepID=A0A9P4IK69_9PEZI|nr:WD40 repeat-like protein [Rhizodiscina lignyota]
MDASSSSMQARRDEILAKKAKLAELKRQRELRQKEFSVARQSIGDASELVSPVPSRADNRKELDSLISSLVGDSRPGSTGPASVSASPARRSRPTSVANVSQLSGESLGDVGTSASTSAVPVSPPAPQRLSVAPIITVIETPSDPKPAPEYVTYSKAVQTDDSWALPRDQGVGADEGEDDEWAPEYKSSRSSKRMSRRDREREEELRENIRREIEDELKALQQSGTDAIAANGTGTQTANFPARALTNEELNAVTSQRDFLDFVERSSKVIERALDNEYDILADYAFRAEREVDEDEDGYGWRGKGGRRVKEIAQFWDERWSKRRMITDLGFSPKFPELVLAAYTKSPIAPHDPPGLVQIWNMHMPSRPEYILHGSSDILCAKFSPFHPSIIVAGTYSGQVLLWDTRKNSHTPTQRTPLTGAGAGHGHSHPVYGIDIVGTQNANNIISCSTDGVVCGWSIDMLTQPAEYLELSVPAALSKIEDIAPTCIAFPTTDPTYFLAGTEEGTIYSCHRYDRAGAKAGVDAKVAYRGHAASVMSLDFHPARGAVDLGDLVISSSIDWSVKIWRVRPPAAAVTGLDSNPQTAGAGLTPGLSGTSGLGAASATAGGVNLGAGGVGPLLEITREDLVYDARWSPVRPGVFACVDGAGSLEVWDVNADVEVPVQKVQPSDDWKEKHPGASSRSAQPGSLSKCAWEPNEGKRIVTGGLDGVVSVFEVGGMLGGVEGVRVEEWAGVKKRVGAWERGLGGNAFANGR